MSPYNEGLWRGFIKDAINTSLPEELNDPKKLNPKPLEAWMIKIDGNFITTSSGKSVWKAVGHAKNALRNHFEVTHSKCNRVSSNYSSNWRDLQEIYEEEYLKFLKERVEFVNIAHVPLRPISNNFCQISGYIYDDRCKDTERHYIKTTHADTERYWMVELEDGEIGIINKSTYNILKNLEES